MSGDVTAAIERLRAYERGFSRVNVSHDQAQRYDDIRAVLDHLGFSEAAGDTLRATVAEMRRHMPGDWQSREVFEGEREVGALRADLAAAQSRITTLEIAAEERERELDYAAEGRRECEAENERLRAEREALHSDEMRERLVGVLLRTREQNVQDRADAVLSVLSAGSEADQ